MHAVETVNDVPQDRVSNQLKNMFEDEAHLSFFRFVVSWRYCG